MEIYFSVCNITVNASKLAALLNSIGPEPYKVIRDMCSPDLPSSKSYDAICAILKGFYTPQVVTFKERKMFYAATKEPDETIVEWCARVKRMAGNCDFGTSITMYVLDKFVTGLDGKCFERLCESDSSTLTLEDAVKLAVKYEKSNESKEVNLIKGKKKFNKNNNSNNNFNNNFKKNEKKDKCSHCGYKNHQSSDCKFKDATCNKCKKKGHIAPNCRSQNGGVNLVETSGNENDVVQMNERLFKIDATENSDNLIYAEIEIGEIKQKFIVDSGSSVSLINEKLFNNCFFKICFKGMFNKVIRIFGS